jgi:hypothetical protein
MKEAFVIYKQHGIGYALTRGSDGKPIPVPTHYLLAHEHVALLTVDSEHRITRIQWAHITPR